MIQSIQLTHDQIVDVAAVVSSVVLFFIILSKSQRGKHLIYFLSFGSLGDKKESLVTPADKPSKFSKTKGGSRRHRSRTAEVLSYPLAGARKDLRRYSR